MTDAHGSADKGAGEPQSPEPQSREPGFPGPGFREPDHEVPLEHLEAEITELAAHLDAATYRWLGLVGEFDKREGWAAWGCRSAAQWLSWKAGISLVAAHEQVRVARRLPEMPLVSAAFSRGELSYSKTRALSRVVTPANEADLVSLAGNATAAHLDRLVRAYRQATPDDTEKANARHARRYLRYYWDDDGTLSISGRLSPEDGAVVVAGLRAAGLVADQRRRGKGQVGDQAGDPATTGDQATSDCPGEPDGKQADADDPSAPQGELTGEGAPSVGDEHIGDSPAGERDDQPGAGEWEDGTPAGERDDQPGAGVTDGGSGTATGVCAGPDETPAGVDDVNSTTGPLELAGCADREEEPDDPWAASQADALVGLAESFLVNAPTSSAQHAQVVVHVGLDALTNDGEGLCDVEDGPALSTETARRLACDAAVVRIIESGDGQPLDVGRSTRTIPPGLRRALQARDRGCRFPTCGQTHFIHGHHVRHWTKGGPTTLANLLSLCSFHHRCVHEGGYTVETTAPGTWLFRRPDGQIIEDPVPTRVSHPGSATLVAANRHLGLDIDSETSVPGWAGERLDYGLAVDALLCLDGYMADDWLKAG